VENPPDGFPTFRTRRRDAGYLFLHDAEKLAVTRASVPLPAPQDALGATNASAPGILSLPASWPAAEAKQGKNAPWSQTTRKLTAQEAPGRAIRTHPDPGVLPVRRWRCAIDPPGRLRNGGNSYRAGVLFGVGRDPPGKRPGTIGRTATREKTT